MRSKRIVSLALSLSLLLGMVGTTGTVPAQAAGTKITIEQVRNMAVANSAEISKKQNELILKRTDYQEAVDTITAKVRNKQTLRWSPLLSFKLPQSLNIVDEYNVHYKPVILQSDITVAEHNLRDLKYEVIGKVSNEFVKIYNAQEKEIFTKQSLRLLRIELERCRAKVLKGQSTQSDVDSMQKSVEKLNDELATLGRDLEAGKKELSDLIKVNVTTGYVFANPLQELKLPRSELNSVTEFTLANDQGYYEAKMAKSTSLITLEAYEKMLNNKNYNEMAAVRPYIAAVKQGSDVDFAAFKIAYKEMLKEMDEPWNTELDFFFFSLPFEWFKGEVDGTRYLEDDLYAAYTACMDYNTARKGEESTRKSLTKQVERDYNTLVNTYNSYLSFVKTKDKANERMQRTAELNRQGRAEYSELQEALETYESSQLDVMDALVSYNELLNSFDRLTCGITSSYLSGADIKMDSGPGLTQWHDVENLPYYSIQSHVEDMAFAVTVNVPTFYAPQINQYELWLGEVQIGSRTYVGEEIVHLALDYTTDPNMTVKLFYDDIYVSTGTINALIPHGEVVMDGMLPPPTRRVIGDYTTTTQQDGEVKTSTINIKPDSALKVAKYNITYHDGTPVYTGELLPIDMPFTHLTLLIPSLENVTLMLYDKDGKLISRAGFDPAEMTITEPLPEQPKKPVVIGRYTLDSTGGSGIYTFFAVMLDSSVGAARYRLINPADTLDSMTSSKKIRDKTLFRTSVMADEYIGGISLELYDENDKLIRVASLNTNHTITAPAATGGTP